MESDTGYRTLEVLQDLAALGFSADYRWSSHFGAGGALVQLREFTPSRPPTLHGPIWVNMPMFAGSEKAVLRLRALASLCALPLFRDRAVGTLIDRSRTQPCSVLFRFAVRCVRSRSISCRRNFLISTPRITVHSTGIIPRRAFCQSRAFLGRGCTTTD